MVSPQADVRRRRRSNRLAVDQQATPERQPPGSFWTRIRHHKVIEWMLAYIAAGFALLNGVELVSHAFEWSSLMDRLTVYILFLGAPVATTLAWYHSHHARQRVSGAELSILIVLLVIAGGVLWLISRSQEHAPRAIAALDRSAGPASREAIPFDPPPHSVAVLPFVNLSRDAKEEYFSEGLTEELLNSLSQISDLQVAARTSSFSFKEHPDTVMVAHKLNVEAVLEGSVRHSERTVRVTVQLINAVTGFHLWSKTYDRDLGDMLKLQTEIATAVAEALKVTLLGDITAKIELGATRNPAAFDAYLRAAQAFQSRRESKDLPTSIALYTDAIRLDPDYALAYAGRSIAFNEYAGNEAKGAARTGAYDKAESDARKATVLAPELAQAHLALAYSSRADHGTLHRHVRNTSARWRSRRATPRSCDGAARSLQPWGTSKSGLVLSAAQSC